MTDGRSLRQRLQSYSLAMIGPAGSAAAQFALSLVLVRRLDSATFGGFSFLLVAAQFSWGLWSALFCAPLPILLATTLRASRASLIRSLMTANLLAAAIAYPLFWFLGRRVGLTQAAALLFAGFGAVALLRWFARAHAYAVGAPLRATGSDVVYALTIAGGLAAIQVTREAVIEVACATLLLGSSLAMVPFGSRYLADQFLDLRLGRIAGYTPVWQEHSGWSVLGVLTTEATANAHVYIVTLLYGPAAFAPLAASALMLRPINIATNALSEFERAQMARHIANRRLDLASASAHLFRFVLIAAWVVTVAGTGVALLGARRFVFPAEYDQRVLVIGAALWSAAAAARILRSPESILLQAGGAFRPLAMASLLSSVGSIVGVVVLLRIGGPLASLGGVVFGEMLVAACVWREASRWKRSVTAGVAIPLQA